MISSLSDKHYTSLTEQLFRREAAKMTAVLSKIFGYQNLDYAEDVVQDSFSKALQNWSLNGVPDNPSAWLYKVAKNKAMDVVRKNKFSEHFDFSGDERDLLSSEYSIGYAMDTLWDEKTIEDDLLRMMFACCHEGISQENQITLILKTLCGFSTTEVANALLVSEDVVSKRLYRAKRFFRDQKIKPEFPGEAHIKPRVSTVLTAVYLLYNEGYQSTHHDIPIRKDLLNQAMYLCKVLIDNPITAFSEVHAAMALMCFHTARIESRITNAGAIVLLADQDRNLWNQELINLGLTYLSKSSIEPYVTSYHFEAAIACEHCITASFESTNWVRILSYYDGLQALHPTSITALNRLIVYYKVHGHDKTLKHIEDSPYIRDWEGNMLFNSFLGDVYCVKNADKAAMYYAKASTLCKSNQDLEIISKKQAQLS
ncbi:MAG: RNA polymerase sigma factor (sigma-70 family) [Bacteroidia bacterium]